MSEKSGTFVVRNADEASAVLADVTDAQVHTLSSNPGVEEGDVVEATLSPDPPMNVTYSVVDVTERKTVPVEESPEPPTTQERDLAADQTEGELVTRERAGIGEIHVLTVPETETENAVADVLADEATVERAARLGVNRVEIRSEPGVVAVRYLP